MEMEELLTAGEKSDKMLDSGATAPVTAWKWR